MPDSEIRYLFPRDGAFGVPTMDVLPKQIAIVLTIAHLNHTPEDCRPENLCALCQKCHLNYDQEYHRLQRALSKKPPVEVALPDGWVQESLDLSGAEPETYTVAPDVQNTLNTDLASPIF